MSEKECLNKSPIKRQGRQDDSYPDKKEIIRRRLKDFEILGVNGEVEFDFNPYLDLRFKSTILSELAFCISTANSSASAGLKFQNSLEDLDLSNGIESVSESEVRVLLKGTGVRFHNRKAKYILKALETFEIEELNGVDSFNAREYLLKNIKGLGFKEASHFLRNIGRKDVAIVDRHIIKCLPVNAGENTKCGVPAKGNKDKNDKSPTLTLTPKKYLDCERALKKMAVEKGMSLAELDLWLWHEKTGKILK